MSLTDLSSLKPTFFTNCSMGNTHITLREKYNRCKSLAIKRFSETIKTGTEWSLDIYLPILDKISREILYVYKFSLTKEYPVGEKIFVYIVVVIPKGGGKPFLKGLSKTLRNPNLEAEWINNPNSWFYWKV